MIVLVDVGGMRRPSGLSTGGVRSLTGRAAVGVVLLCIGFGVAAVGVGVAGVLGVRSTTRTGHDITADEVATATATAQAGRAIDNALVTGQQIVLSVAGSARTAATAQLLNTSLPAADAAVHALVDLHANDMGAEKTDIVQFAAQWAAVRALLVSEASDLASGPSALASLVTVTNPISAHLDRLVDREKHDANIDQRDASAVMTSITWIILVTVAFSLASAIVAAWYFVRRVKAALRPERDQVEFADTLQLADSEREAHALLKLHLERAVARSTVTVLNRNNSADRLEAVTSIAPDSCLARTLQHAQPRSCLAVRSGRRQHQGGDRPSLLLCAVCSTCEGMSSCSPLTVGGEVIGSVLVTSPSHPTPPQESTISNSVSQAAPILANLRNLAIAETRAATDALTGLPNKRGLNDTLKRMLAQASRALVPLSVLSIDLDHFKAINDRYGHPVGDQALADVGAVLTSALRDSDFASRNGGEEFTVLLANADCDGAIPVAEKIRAAIAEIPISGGNERLSASIGVAAYPVHAATAEQLERLADAALYVAKRAGRNRVEIAHTPPEPGPRTPLPPVLVDSQPGTARG